MVRECGIHVRIWLDSVSNIFGDYLHVGTKYGAYCNHGPRREGACLGPARSILVASKKQILKGSMFL